MQAVLARDSSHDGAFVYGVRSTGVYCRPSCPSRRPRPEQIVFFPVPEVAERAGFRSCRRCRPRQASPQDHHVELVRAVCRYIHEASDGPPSAAELGSHVGARPYHMQRVFKRIMGITPRQYADACRMNGFKALLREGWNVTTALYESGFGSSSRLYEQASGQLGMTPASYRRGGRGAHIAYAIVDSFLGRLLVAATEKGICAVKLGLEDEELEADLLEEYPHAEISVDDTRMEGWVAGLLLHLDGRLPMLDLPLDIVSTAFQRQVWERLRAIPYGQTRSYREVAEAIGHPEAARAVGRACAANPVPLLIPCHRVLRANGDIGGYRFGSDRKAALLEKERANRGT